MYLDLNLDQEFMIFDQRIHRRVGPAKIEMVRISECKTYRERLTREVHFKSGDHSLFLFRKQTEGSIHFPYTQISTQRAACETYLGMEASSELLKMKYIHMLDTIAKQNSHLDKLWDSLRAISDKTCPAATLLNPELIRKKNLTYRKLEF